MSTILATTRDVWTSFMDAVAGTCERLQARYAGKKSVTLTETGSGEFSAITDSKGGRRPLGSITVDDQFALTGSGPQAVEAIKNAQVKLILDYRRFLIRDLPLPAQASGFLQQIIQNQIDRLTPWPSDRAIFGFVHRETTPTKLVVSIAAADQRVLAPLIDAIAHLRPSGLVAFAGPSSVEDTPLIPLLMKRGVGVVQRRLLRTVLATILLCVAFGAAGYQAYGVWMKMRLDDQYDAAQSEIVRRRAALRVIDPSADATASIFARKIAGPSATLVLEELSRVLPDDTYLTELELDGDKVRVTGTARDATTLIGLMEKSPELAEANFYAPTTRSAADPGERFHIEATIKPRGELVR